MSTETKTETGALTKAGPYGVELEKDKEYFYCTCGLSQSQVSSSNSALLRRIPQRNSLQTNPLCGGRDQNSLDLRVSRGGRSLLQRHPSFRAGRQEVQCLPAQGEQSSQDCCSQRRKGSLNVAQLICSLWHSIGCCHRRKLPPLNITKAGSYKLLYWQFFN